MFNKKFYFALASLIGAIIGVGIFGIPYVVARAGFALGCAYLIFLGGAVLLLHLVYGEIAARSREKHRLPGYALKYLGRWAQGLAFCSVTFGLFSALLAYIIVASDFLFMLLPFLFPSALAAGIFFWAVLSLAVWRGIKTVAWMEFLMALFLFMVMAVILFWGAPRVNAANLTGLNPAFAFLPFGVTFFALIGLGVIPEIKEILGGRSERSFGKVIILGTLIPAVLYLVFTLLVVGVCGEAVSPEAIGGLSRFLGKDIAALGSLFGLLAVSTSFLLWGINLKHTFIYDLKIGKNTAAGLVAGVPLLFFLLGFRSFIGVIGLAGAVMAAIEGNLILLMFRRAKKMGDRQPEYNLKLPSILLYFLMVLFIAGAICQILSY